MFFSLSLNPAGFNIFIRCSDVTAHQQFGKFGIAIRAVDEGWTVASSGARQRLPQQSVSKLWVAITLLDLRDQGKARLDEPIVVRPEDLTLFHQPIAMLVKGEGYRTDVNWATRMSGDGIFIHAAPWSVAQQGNSNVSHGCINISTENGKWVYDTIPQGTPIVVRGTVGGQYDGN